MRGDSGALICVQGIMKCHVNISFIFVIPIWSHFWEGLFTNAIICLFFHLILQNNACQWACEYSCKWWKLMLKFKYILLRWGFLNWGLWFHDILLLWLMTPILASEIMSLRPFTLIDSCFNTFYFTTISFSESFLTAFFLVGDNIRIIIFFSIKWSVQQLVWLR